MLTAPPSAQGRLVEATLSAAGPAVVAGSEVYLLHKRENPSRWRCRWRGGLMRCDRRRTRRGERQRRVQAGSCSSALHSSGAERILLSLLALTWAGAEFAAPSLLRFITKGKEHTMADIHVEKRNAVWPWVLGLVLLAVLIWAFVAGRGDDRTTMPATGQTTTTPATTTAATTTTPPATAPVAGTADTWPDRTTTAGTAGTAGTTGYAATDTSARDMTGLTTDQIPVAAIVEQPQQYRQQTVSGVATVAEVDAQRGVWIEQGGERLLVVLSDTGAQAGQTAQQQMVTALRPGESVRLTGVVHDQSTAGQLGTDPQVQQRVAGQDVFLTATDIQPADQIADSDLDDDF
jgi:hypothetical protein